MRTAIDFVLFFIFMLMVMAAYIAMPHQPSFNSELVREQ